MITLINQKDRKDITEESIIVIGVSAKDDEIQH